MGAAAVRELVVDIGVADVGEFVVDVGSADVEADNVGADDVADAVRELGADAVKELGAGVVEEQGADGVGVDDVMVSDESVVGVVVNVAAGAGTVGTATPAGFLSARSGFSVPAGGAGLLSASSGADVGMVANLRGGIGGCETITTASRY